MLSLFTPIFIILLTTRLLFNPIVFTLEKYMPQSSSHAHLSGTQRSALSRKVLAFILNRLDEPSLRSLRFENGSAVFNAREIAHLQDVKQVVQKVLTFFNIVLLLFVLGGVWFFCTGNISLFWQGLYKGSLYTLGLAIIMLPLVGGLLLARNAKLISESFWQLFTWFHLLFFEGDSWLFNESDTLIQLFPLTFWQNIFMLFWILAVLIGLIGSIVSYGSPAPFDTIFTQARKIND